MNDMYKIFIAWLFT